MAWFGNGLSGDIDPGLLRRPSRTTPSTTRKPASYYATTPARARPTPSPPLPSGSFDKAELDRAWARKQAAEKLAEALEYTRRVGESDGEYFRRTGQQRGTEEGQAELRRLKAAKEYRDRMDATRLRNKQIARRAESFDWSTATDEFEASKAALDRQHEEEKIAAEIRRKNSPQGLLESDGAYFRRTGRTESYRAPAPTGTPTKMPGESDGDYFRRTGVGQEGRGNPAIDPAFQTTTRRPATDFYSSTTPITTTSTVAVDPAFQTTTSTVAIDRSFLNPALYVAPVSPPSTPSTPRKPASYYVPSTKPTGVPGLPPPVLPATQVSLLDAKKHLNVVKPADKRPVPSYLTTAAYDNPGKRQPFDSAAWRLQDRIVALAPFNKPNNEWNDPGEAVKASAKFRKALVDTDYSTKRKVYIDAKSRLENQKAALKTIKKNVKNLQDAEGFSGLGHTEHTPTGDLLEYWKKEESKAEAELVKLQATYSTARSAEVNAGREVKLARNNMDKYLRRGPYTRDTKAAIGGFLGMALGGLIVFNIIVPTSFKKKTRNLNPLYSVFA